MDYIDWSDILNRFYVRYIKRIVDVLFSLLGLLILFPIMILIAMIIRLRLGSPVMFKQVRPGKNQKLFTLYKFRTMAHLKTKEGHLLPDSKRMTKLGNFLRKSSLDELPELWNILKGDMSFIGPRPLLVEYLPLYNDSQRKRHEVRPGLSGLAQIKGRNAISWPDKFSWDLKYIENISLKLDMIIFIQTIIKVLKRENINTEGSVSAEKFRGNDYE